MQVTGAMISVFCALTLLSPATATDDNPLSKVLELMDALAAKISKEGEAEAKAYNEYFEWCDDASKNLQFAITSATKQQAELQAEINKCIGDVQAAENAIEELATGIATADADLDAATKIRNKEGADFESAESELLDTIDTLTRAINILSREMAKNPASLAQIDTTSMNSLVASLGAVIDAASFSGADRSKLLALVQDQENSEDDQEPGAPAAAVYKSRSGNIVDVLEDMKEKAEEQLSALRKSELTAKHNFDMLKQSLEDQLAQDTKNLAEQKEAKTSAEGARATAEGDLTATAKDLAQSTEALQSMQAECMATAADHEATVRGRKEELAVIAKAKKIVAESSGGAVEQSYSLLQLQGGSRASLAGAEVVAMVKKLASEQHSMALAQLASRISAVMKYSHGQDPFAKVKGLIADLISKLEAEAKEDATEKAYCDEQMSKTGAKKEELDSAIAKLTTKIDSAAAASARLKEETRDLQSELAALARTQAEMDSVRAEEHAAYVEAKDDLEQGLQGVRQALKVLREYYGGAASMLQSDADLKEQMEQPAKPELHSKATGAGQSIIDLLEVCESDFAKNLAEEETEEDDSASSYEKISQENAITKTTKEQDVKYKTRESASLDKEISELSTDRDTENTELAAVMEYFAKIKDRCIAKPETYEERKRRREAEIAGLKEALRVLDEETAFIQKTKRNLRNHRALSL